MLCPCIPKKILNFKGYNLNTLYIKHFVSETSCSAEAMRHFNQIEDVIWNWNEMVILKHHVDRNEFEQIYQLKKYQSF